MTKSGNNVREKLSALNEEQWRNVEYMEFKDVTTMLIISFLVGEFGVDRFMLGDTKNGIFKLVLTLLCGIGLIWWIIDLINISEMTRKYNYQLLNDTLSYV